METDTRILVIDDSPFVVERINNQRAFGSCDNVRAELCLSMLEVVKVIGDFHPTHLFLDHFLGGEAVGHEIAEAMRGKMTIFSTTGTRLDMVLAPYEKMGIEHVGKLDIAAKITELLGLVTKVVK